METDTPSAPLVGHTLQNVVRHPNRKNYFPGKGCMCSANGAADCACEGVDWTSREEHRFRDALEAIKADYEFCKDKPEFGDRAAAYYETVCVALQPNTVLNGSDTQRNGAKAPVADSVTTQGV